eukprot:gene26136-32669_t
MTYQALQIEKDDAGYRCSLKTLEDSALPEGDVTVQVDYSTLNYKDGLAITGKSPVVRKFPLTPGIDLAGTVTDSQHPLFKAGDKVVLNGWGVGESHSGGLAQKARLKGDWLVKLPAAFTPRHGLCQPSAQRGRRRPGRHRGPRAAGAHCAAQGVFAQAVSVARGSRAKRADRQRHCAGLPADCTGSLPEHRPEKASLMAHDAVSLLGVPKRDLALRVLY